MVAARLNVDLDALGVMARWSHRAIVISRMFRIFAEMKIIGRLAIGMTPEAIASGIDMSEHSTLTRGTYVSSFDPSKSAPRG